MIAKVFPKDFQRYLSLPVLGPLMNPFAAWLHEQQYTHRSTRYELRMAVHVCDFLKRQGFQQVEDVGEQDLETCYRLFRRKFPKEAGSVHVLARFLLECDYVQARRVPDTSRADIHLDAIHDPSAGCPWLCSLHDPTPGPGCIRVSGMVKFRGCTSAAIVVEPKGC